MQQIYVLNGVAPPQRQPLPLPPQAQHLNHLRPQPQTLNVVVVPSSSISQPISFQATTLTPSSTAVIQTKSGPTVVRSNMNNPVVVLQSMNHSNNFNAQVSQFQHGVMQPNASTMNTRPVYTQPLQPPIGLPDATPIQSVPVQRSNAAPGFLFGAMVNNPLSAGTGHTMQRQTAGHVAAGLGGTMHALLPANTDINNMNVMPSGYANQVDSVQANHALGRGYMRPENSMHNSFQMDFERALESRCLDMSMWHNNPAGTANNHRNNNNMGGIVSNTSLPSLPSFPSLPSLPSLTSISSNSECTEAVSVDERSKESENRVGGDLLVAPAQSGHSTSRTTTETNTACPVRVYTCSYCGKTFKQSHSLKDHIRTHTGEKPYGCDHCGRKFKVKYNMVVHRRIHTGVKPYSCEVCAKRYASKSGLNAHQKKHHAAYWKARQTRRV